MNNNEFRRERSWSFITFEVLRFESNPATQGCIISKASMCLGRVKSANCQVDFC